MAATKLYSKHNLAMLSSILLMITAVTTASNVISHPVLTYKNASTLLGQLVTSSTLMWETYNPEDVVQLQYAVEGGKYITDEEHYPIYVCRVTIEGAPTSGYTEKVKQEHKCVAAHYGQRKYDSFDVLVNKGHLSKVSWVPWRTFNAGIPVGSISIDSEAYIARHHIANTSYGMKKHFGADYNFGRLQANEGLGKIKVFEGENDHSYDEGEVLVETEPFRYELRDIKLDSIRLSERENIMELGSAVLANRDDTYGKVETVISYEFDRMQYWGTHEGAARGLPTKIYEKDLKKPTEVGWALKSNERRYESKIVHAMLHPGTAMNVTLRGTYVTLEAPYTAQLYAFYWGSDDSVKRKITAEVRKSYLKDVKLENSDIYYLGNGSFVPTTTTTSTTSTTARSTSTRVPAPLNEPPKVYLEHVGQAETGLDAFEKSLHDSSAVISNEIGNELPENLSEKHQTHALAGVALTKEHNNNSAIQTKCSLALILLVLMFV